MACTTTLKLPEERKIRIAAAVDDIALLLTLRHQRETGYE